MVKLSRKGWNNVIIIAVLVVIVLLHRLEQAQQANSAQRLHGLLPEGAVVLTWQGPSWTLERMGQGWRTVPDLGLDNAALSRQVEQWQGWQLLPSEPLRGTPVEFRLWLAGQGEPLRLALYQDNGRYAVRLGQDRWLTLSTEQYRALLKPTP